MKNSNPNNTDQRKTAVITGASGVLGAALASELSAHDWRIILHGYKNAARLQELSALPGVVATISGDLADPDACKQLIDLALNRFDQRLDALIHCAGISDDGPFSAMTDEQFQRVIDVNLSSAIHLAKRLARPFARSKSGSYILIGSMAGESGRAGGSAYAASKSGLVGLAKSLAREWAQYHIQTNVVIPGVMLGATMTPELESSAADIIIKRSLIGEQSPKEVACFIFALLETRGITGQVLCTDSRITA